MAEQTPKVFADGFSFRSPAEGAPEFVLGRLSCNTAKAIAFLKAHTDDRGWVNMKILMSKQGSEYVELDTWKPSLKKPQFMQDDAKEEETDDSIPF